MLSTLTLIRQFPAGLGGAEKYLQLLIQGFSEKQIQINLLCADYPQESPLNKIPNLNIIRLDPYRLSQIRWMRPWYFSWLAKNWVQKNSQPLVISLERYWQQNLLRAGDGVHAAWLQQRYQLQNSFLNLFTKLSPFHQLLLWSEKKAYHPQNTQRVIANSHLVKKQIVDFLHFPEEHIDVVYNGVDLKPWQPSYDPWLKKYLGLTPDCVIALFVGSGWQRKGLKKATEIVDAWQKQNSRQIKLIVIGKGPEKRYRHPLVYFSGPKPPSETGRFYQGADLLLFPTYYDPFANVTLEALASGLPVITSTHNGASEILTEGQDGIAFTPEAPTELWVQAINHFSNPEQRNLTRQLCRQKAQQFSLENHLLALISLCEKVTLSKS
ncbi:MAG: glycosyltransferase family 4 protein [Verrucomicrobiia bacterium]